MQSANRIVIALLIAGLLASLPACAGNDRAAVAADREALVALYQATNGADWRDNRNWLSDQPLDEWEGVATDSNGRVVALDLSFNRLSGPIPSELGSLSALTRLNLSYNRLTGAIPAELGNLPALKRLIIYQNRLSGSLPPELGNLSSLTILDFYENQLTGPVPTEWSNLSNLFYMDVELNQLTGQLPADFTNLSNLEYLHFGSNATLCAPPEMQTWLAGLQTAQGPGC